MASLARAFTRQLHVSQRRAALSKFQMPAMSPTMTEGGIASWKKKEGELFSAGDVLLEVETDKATIDVEAQDDGILAKIIAGEGSKGIPVGSPIAVIAEQGDDLSGVEALASETSPSDHANPPKENEAPKHTEAPPTERGVSKSNETAPVNLSSPDVLASPIARKIALRNGIPLSQIKGSGPGGRIIRADVDQYKPAPTPSSIQQEDFTDIPVSNMRRAIGTRLTRSKQDLPHYYLTVDINMDQVFKLRELFNEPASKAKTDVKLSLNDFIIKAAASALKDVPEANSAWMGDYIRQYSRADISIAVATPTGLITPIIKDVGSKGLALISAESKALAKKARDAKLLPQEYEGGTFTISNLGMYDIDHFTAIINPPQSCILAVGSVKPTIVPAPEENNGFKTVKIMKATLSSDHRTVDGAVGARWISSFKTYLEHPLTFML